ncbi:MAG: hypothetical protein ACYTFG_18385, partial [Planctomycetota bacterium]
MSISKKSVLLLLALFLAWTPVLAESGGEDDEGPKKVFVPVEDWDEVVKAEPDGILLSYKEYSILRALARRTRQEREGREGPPPSTAVLQSAEYSASLEGKLLKVKAVFRIEVRVPGTALLPLQLDRIGVLAASLDGKDASLYRNPRGRLELLLHGRGAHVLDMTFVAPVKELPMGKEVRISLPKAPAAKLLAKLPGDLEVRTEPALTETKKVGDATEIFSALAGTSSYFLHFRPKAV